MKAIQNIFSRKGFYVLGIPAFFVIHGYLQNFGLIPVRDGLLLLFTYWMAAALLYLLCWLLYRNPFKASLLTAFLLSFFLFFGAIDNFLKAHFYILSRYSVILPLFLILTTCLTVYLKKKKRTYYHFTFFINILLCIYLLIDLTAIGWKSVHPDNDKLSIYGSNKLNNYQTCTDCKNPDIYFLLFDEYSSSQGLRESFHYDNSDLDSFLLQMGFSLQRQSRSNYNFTPFSIASILNMNYISGIKNISACTLADYIHCNNLIRNNEVIHFLSSRQYDIINYSIFDLAGNPTLVELSILPVKTRLLTEQTMYNRLMHDIGWNLFTGKFEIKWLSEKLLFENFKNNNRFLADVKQESRIKGKNPRFVYAHFEMPHRPYYYDKNFQLRERNVLAAEETGNHPESYLGFIPYTNSRIKELVDTIQANTNHSAVIIIMGDHGFRSAGDTQLRENFFKNLNAVYFPSQSYHLMRDSISGVNQFRMILNTLFKQQLPILKDSTVFLIDQQ